MTNLFDIDDLDYAPPHPPYIWFGGKRKVSPIVWGALGDVDHYVEPFFGGGSVFLLRPHRPRLETINDYDGFVANFWRAVQADHVAVADALDWPVNEVDLEARHRFLCRQPDKDEFLARMRHDAKYYDTKRAAWWCWGLNAWIGRGWCEGEYFPAGGSHGSGVCDGANKLPHLGRSLGVHRQLPHLGNSGQGVHRQLPSTTDRREWLTDWMRQLCDRMRGVRVCCGDWSRICTDGATAHGAVVGMFLDPPYSAEANRDAALYRIEDLTVAHRVRDYCLSRTGQDRYRIVLAGYEGEHDELEQHGWRVVAWKANGGMANIARGDTQGKINTHRERLWLSPSCLGGGE
jgi:site-specific DNA-adenine methylase